MVQRGKKAEGSDSIGRKLYSSLSLNEKVTLFKNKVLNAFGLSKYSREMHGEVAVNFILGSGVYFSEHFLNERWFEGCSHLYRGKKNPS